MLALVFACLTAERLTEAACPCPACYQPACFAAARSAHDKLAWAVHAFLLAEGFKLVATGSAAENEGTGRDAGGTGPHLGMPPCRWLLPHPPAWGRTPAFLAPRHATDFSASREEVAPTGWDALPGAYAFRYQDTEGRAPWPGRTARGCIMPAGPPPSRWSLSCYHCRLSLLCAKPAPAEIQLLGCSRLTPCMLCV